MSKVIRVEDRIYDELDRLRGRRDTFSQVIEYLLTIRDQSQLMEDKLYLPGVDPTLLANRSGEGQAPAPGERP